MVIRFYRKLDIEQTIHIPNLSISSDAAAKPPAHNDFHYTNRDSNRAPTLSTKTDQEFFFTEISLKQSFFS